MEKYICMHVKLLQWCLFVTPWAVALQGPLSIGFSRQEYKWVALPFSRVSTDTHTQN